VAIRSRLYSRVGAAQARKLLGVNFPGGSARSEIRRRIATLSEKGEVENATLGAVIEKIVEELVGSTKISLDELNKKAS
jgi:intracellular multiplication protein IcmB